MSNLQRFFVTITTPTHFGLWTTLFFCCFFAFSCKKNTHPALDVCENLVWQNPDSCMHYLLSIDTAALTEQQQMVWLLHMQHAYLRLNNGLTSDSTIVKLSNYFENRQQWKFAGEALSILGRHYYTIGNYPQAAYNLKRAEDYLENTDTHTMSMACVYYFMGLCSETERLFEIANAYYQKALPLFRQADNKLFLATTYRELARSMDDNIDGIPYIDSALMYIAQVDYPAIQKEIELFKYQRILKKDTSLIYLNSKALCDLGYIRHADYLTEYYTNRQQLDSANYYLQILSYDTAHQVWSREHYFVRQAEILRASGQYEQAYQILQLLHENQTHDIENSAHSRVFMIEKFYDAEKERTHYLQEQLRKQHAIIIGGMILLIAIVITAILVIYLLHMREKAQLLNKQNELLNQDNLKKRQILQQQLTERLEMSRILRTKIKSNKPITPQDIDEFLSQSLCFDTRQWQRFAADFDDAFDNILQHLQADYPTLTPSDLSFIALNLLKCPIEVTSMVLNINKQSFWNRKARLRSHLGIDTDLDLEQWLQNYQANHVQASQVKK